jgi:hypothetical protein
MDAQLNDFLALSSELTGFTPYDLAGTGQARLYLTTILDIVGDANVTALINAFRDVSQREAAAIERGIRIDILSDEKLGPLARNVIKMWYVGSWYELPGEWRERFGENDKDRTFVVSPASYVEGLLWPAIGANPSGAKPLGYGTWADPPRIDERYR